MRTVLAALAAGLMLAGCGEDSDEATGRTGTAGTGTGTVAAAAEVPEGVTRDYLVREQEIAAEGGEQSAGDWRVGFIVEGAEGWFDRRGDGYRWRAPAADETHHIEILPIEAETGRLVPDVPVTLEVLDEHGERVARKTLRFYHAEFFHYAENFALPGAGTYTLKATIGPPAIRRHGEPDQAPALREGATVTFEDVEIDDA